MSTVRRRSRDPKLVPVLEGSMRGERGERSKTLERTILIVATFLSALIIAVFLSQKLLPGLVGNHLTPALWTIQHPLSHPQQPTKEDDPFRLNPADHAFRNATTSIYHWRITSALRRPDGVLKRVYLVNNVFPGPTIEARSGDRVIIHVDNALEDEEAVSIHWHGLSMRGANDMDGATGITSSPILSGRNFTYDFTIDSDQHGTFWWHAHDGVQRADGFYGGFIIHKPALEMNARGVNDELLLLIGDWYHRSAADALAFYMHPGAFGLETVPDSILTNGQGAFTCSDAVPARPLDCVEIGPDTLRKLRLDSSHRNTLRVVNVGAYAGFSITIPGARLKPLSVDGGHAVEGVPARTVGVLHPGERVELLVEPESTVASRSSHLLVTLDDSTFKYENPALTASHRFPSHWHGELAKQDHRAVAVYEKFDVQTIKSASDQAGILPAQANLTIVLYTLTQKLARLENEPHGFINHTRWMPQSPPLIDLPHDKWDKHQFVPLIKHKAEDPEWVDIVLNNLDEDSHPFHLHGYDFWVLSKYSSDFNWGSYNPFEDVSPPGGEYDLHRAVKRDTFYVPRRGYAVLRLRADNPGLWMFHCHVLWHQASGMAMAFEVS